MALTKIDDRGVTYPLDLLDNEKIRFGTGNDLEIFHSGSDSYIKDVGTGILQLNTNYLQVKNADDNETILTASQNGAVSLYYDNVKTFETHSNGVIIRGPESGSADLYMYADEGDDDADKWRLQAENGSSGFTLKNSASGSLETNIKAVGNGAVEIYYDNSKKLETNAQGILVGGDVDNDTDTQGVALQTGGKIRSRVADASADAFIVSIEDSGASKVVINGAGNGFFDGGLDVPDSAKIQLGTGDDLQIYHDGGDSWIKDNGTGRLWVATNLFQLIDSTSSETMLRAAENGAVELYYDSSKKLETRTDGINVTGDIHPTGHIYMDSGYGIAFDPYGGSGVNLLDSYEEGTWTPGISFNNGTTGITYDTSGTDATGGWYTRIGRLVNVTAAIKLTSKGSSTGNCKVTGLPFSTGSAGDDSGRGSGTVGYIDNFALAAPLLVLAESNQTSFNLRKYVADFDDTDNITHSNFTDTSRFFFSLSYYA